MLCADGTAKVLDFGLAAQLHTSLSRISQVKYGTSGTGPYMAPEQWRGRNQGAPTDQYALGVTVYELLCGRLPAPGPGPGHVHGAGCETGLPAESINLTVPLNGFVPVTAGTTWASVSRGQLRRSPSTDARRRLRAPPVSHSKRARRQGARRSSVPPWQGLVRRRRLRTWFLAFPGADAILSAFTLRP